MMEFRHKSIMVDQVVRFLSIKPDGTYVDGTLGGGGHSYEIAKRLDRGGRLIGIDQDQEAVRAAGDRLAPFSDRVSIFRNNYSEIEEVLREAGADRVSGILLDLGVSSYQFDAGDRGFSYRNDGVLDMRMDRRQELTAGEVVNEYSEPDLTRIIRGYGEEKFAARISAAIIKARQKGEIRTTGDLAEIIKEAIPARARRTGGHPAKRTFQALRIEVNRELQVLSDSLPLMIDRLEDGGRICVISFHSLEDRIIKRAFRTAENPCVCPPEFPVCVCGRRPKGHVITRKPVTPDPEEMEENSRAKSAKLRVFERSINKDTDYGIS